MLLSLSTMSNILVKGLWNPVRDSTLVGQALLANIVAGKVVGTDRSSSFHIKKY